MFSLNNVLYFQVGLGTLANIFLLFFYTMIILCHRSKPMDMISCQLTFVHTMMCLTGGNVWLTDLLGSLNIVNDFICKATFYINRVMRGLSICITCLLSVFQAVTISPNTSLLAKFKHKLKNTWSFLSSIFGLSICHSALTGSSMLVLIPTWVRPTSWRWLNTAHSSHLLVLSGLFRQMLSGCLTFWSGSI